MKMNQWPVWMSFLLVGAALAGTTAKAVSAGGAPEGGPLGFGLFLGEPTGLMGEYWRTQENAIDFGVAYSFSNYFALAADYTWHFPDAFAGAHDRNLQRIHPFVGVGAYAAFAQDRNFLWGTSNTYGIGFRVPLGLYWGIPHSPGALMVELAPGVSVLPSTTAILTGGFGVLYFL